MSDKAASVIFDIIWQTFWLVAAILLAKRMFGDRGTDMAALIGSAFFLLEARIERFKRL